jgi:prophage regulatory protein
MQAEASQLRRTDGIAREAERRELTGVSTSSWYALQAQGLAPKPVKLGPRAVGWLRSELLAWVRPWTAGPACCLSGGYENG